MRSTPPKISSKQIVETGIVFAIICIIAGIRTGLHLFYYCAAALLLLTLIVPVVVKPLAIAWFGLSKILGWVTSRFLLSIIFYFLVTPVGWLRRLLKKDRLQVNNFKKGSADVFEKRNYEFTVKDLEAPY